MLRTRGRESDVAWVYGAAVRAADGRATDVASSALNAGSTREERMVAAVRRAMAVSPCAELADLPLEQREPIALARILGLDVDQIATTLGCDRAEVKARMRCGLTRLAGTRALADMPVG
jgi:DNA-directed RNA polymerase specialized sigma24 family protein